MWPFLFIIALVPLIFFWSDSVRELFPALSDWLPEKVSPHATPAANGEVMPTSNALDTLANQWIISNTPQGFVAWTLSSDKQYRLAVGCYPGAAATVQVTHADGQELKRMLALNYQYGQLPLEEGKYLGPELVPSVAQFSDVYLQTPAGAVVTQFKVHGYISGALAREVQSVCAPE